VWSDDGKAAGASGSWRMIALRVAMVARNYWPTLGGVESHVQQLAERLVERGHFVEVLTQQDSLCADRESVERGVVVRRYSVPLPSTNFPVAPELLSALRRARTAFDLFHVHGYHTVAPVFGTLAKVRPLIFTPHYHGTGHSTFRKLLHRPYRRVGDQIARRADQIICVSQAEADVFLSHFSFASPKINVIPNGIDSAALLEARPFSEESGVLISAGRLESYKNVDRTIGAMVHLPDRKLVITGDGSQRIRLQELARSLGVDDRVSFLGRIETDTLYRWFQTAEVYVSMSTNEAMPVTISEVLATGARVVASDIPAHRDIARRTGGAIEMIAVGSSPIELAAAIDRAFAPVAGSQQRLATWDEVVDETLAVYRAAIK
jgi:glycosyltransferase involved in cell wall biosynthesis